MKKSIVSVILLISIMALLTGCGSGEKKAVEAAAQSYADLSMTGKWADVMKASTGEQLSVLNLLVESLEAAPIKTDVRLIEVLDTSVDGKTANATVHIVRDMQVADYGTMTDDRQVLYHLYKVNEEWKVFRVDVLLDQL